LRTNREGFFSIMGALDERLMADLKDAMRAGDTNRRDVIRFLRAAFKNAQIARVQVPDDLEAAAARGEEVARSADRDRPLDDAEELAVLQRQIKQRQDSIEQFAQAKRDDLVARESAQLAVLREYLPAGMSEAEVEALTRAVIAETGATGPRDMKLVMPALIARAGGRADSRALSDAAKRLLASA
jgi:uncharacterized protein YqeY